MKGIRPVITPYAKDPSSFMNSRILCSVVFLGLLTAVWPSAATRYMSADEVRPGMVGIGRTVFEGNRIEEFKVHLLGVLRNTTGPRRDLVLARLEGGPLAAAADSLSARLSVRVVNPVSAAVRLACARLGASA